jgi:hypothetical protein
MKRAGLAAMAASLLLLSIVMPLPVQALPQNEVDNYFYDADWNQIGEKDILCDGYHYTWGVTSGAAHMTGYTQSCSTGGGSWGCYYWDDQCGCYVQTDLTYCGL